MVFSEEKGGRSIEVYFDDFVTNPRDEYEHPGRLLCWHRRLILGGREDQHVSRRFNPRAYDGWEELEQAVVEEFEPVAMLPVYLFEHSGVALQTTPFNDPWDSGRVGLIVAGRTEVLKVWGDDALKEQVETALRAEVQEYSQYLNGAVYGYAVKDVATGEIIDSCSGIYGDLDEVLKMAEWR
jgi:hypothetical protein